MTTTTVLPGPERRRRWTTAEKLRIVEESLNAGISVIEFARQRDLHPNLVHTWRWQARKGMLSETSNGEARFAPVAIAVAADPMRAANTGEPIDVARLVGRPCYLAVDLSSKQDISATVKLFPPVERETKWIIVPRFFTP